MQFEGKTALVVGGTSGIGLATARLIVEGGGSAVAVGSNAAKAEAAERGLSAIGSAQALTVDLAAVAASVDGLLGTSTNGSNRSICW